ncbi:MAG TPA: anaerobic sulfatase maturase, partial [Balneolales bacterium]|nr:anaerobic sulfatase maturase [Balneolales bacterium]
KLDDEWCEFLSENHFLVGVSIDGPRKIHDSYRIFKSGKPSFDHVMAGIERLKEYQVEFNTLTTVHHNNADQGKIIYRFLKRIGSRYIQFIPIVERTANDNEGLANPQTRKHSQVTEWSVESTKYGQFLIDVFDEWIKKDVGKIFVQMFDVALASWYGVSPGLCVYSETCGKALAMEHNGDIYSCDHYVYPEFKLGNIMSDSLGDMVNSPFQKKFGAQKKNALPKYCQDCEYRFACNGGCPKHRFLQTPDGEKGWNYLCKGYKKYFKHIEPYMRFMVNELQHNRPPANVMKYRKNIG